MIVLGYIVAIYLVIGSFYSPLIDVLPPVIRTPVRWFLAVNDFLGILFLSFGAGAISYGVITELFHNDPNSNVGVIIGLIVFIIVFIYFIGRKYFDWWD